MHQTAQHGAQLAARREIGVQRLRGGVEHIFGRCDARRRDFFSGRKPDSRMPSGANKCAFANRSSGIPLTRGTNNPGRMKLISE